MPQTFTGLGDGSGLDRPDRNGVGPLGAVQASQS